MNTYELAVLLGPDVDAKAKTDQIKKLLEENSKVLSVDDWGVKELAYPVKKLQKGYYLVFNLELLPGNVGALDKSVKLQEDIARYILIKQIPQKASKGKIVPKIEEVEVKSAPLKVEKKKKTGEVKRQKPKVKSKVKS